MLIVILKSTAATAILCEFTNSLDSYAHDLVTLRYVCLTKL